MEKANLRCPDCGCEHPLWGERTGCACGGPLDVSWDLPGLRGSVSWELWDGRLGSKHPLDRSGVWRYRELLPVPWGPGGPGGRGGAGGVTRAEGSTPALRSEGVARYCGLEELVLKHEGENPTGSFKDRGMTVGITVALSQGWDRVACASTGNTAASMAAYAALAGLEALVLVPAGGVASGKLSQAIAYGARTVLIRGGDFDRAMALVREICASEGIYLLNSVNPFRIEGQKTLAFELAQDLGEELPDWVVVPGGNLGNGAAIHKGFRELAALGLVERTPRIAVVQAAGANPLVRAFKSGRPLEPAGKAETLASAIRVGNPQSWKRSLRAIRESEGLAEDVSDEEILEAKAVVDASGVGAEPASCAAVAGARKLVRAGIIRPDERVCAILTGHLLKDPDAVMAFHAPGRAPGGLANPPLEVSDRVEELRAALR